MAGEAAEEGDSHMLLMEMYIRTAVIGTQYRGFSEN